MRQCCKVCATVFCLNASHNLRRPLSPGLLCGLLARSARAPPDADNMAAPLLRPPGVPTPRTSAAGGSPAGAPTPRGTLIWRLLSPRRKPHASPGDAQKRKVPLLETVVSVGPLEGEQAAMLAAPHAQPPQSALLRSGTHFLLGMGSQLLCC